MSGTEETSARLKESVVKEALKRLTWTPLEQHLLTVELDDVVVAELVGHIRRSSDFLLKRPDPKREASRARFIDALNKHLAGRVGAEQMNALNDLLAMIQQIEAGYAEMHRTLQGTVAAKLLPEIQASAALNRAAYSYHELMEEFHSSVAGRKELTLQSLRIPREDGSTYSPDGVLAGINETATMTLLLLGHQHKWFNAAKYLVLPNLPQPTDDEVYKAGLTEILAVSWRHWERMEQRCRYFDGTLKISRKGSLPDWAPEPTEKLVEYDRICVAERFDYVANQRLNDHFVQTFQEMLLQTNLQEKAVGLTERVGLPPDGFVSTREGHAGVSLSEILGYAIGDDRETPCGLRLVEWIRGYSVLQLLAEERYSQLGKGGLLITIERHELCAVLERLGLRDGSAERFIDLVSLHMSSRDLLDQPLVRVHDGSLLLYGPGILNSDPARLTLSAIANRRQQLSRKGKAFEAEMLKFLRDKGFDAKTLKFKQDGEEYEYDVIVPWDDHVFVFECKNRSLSGHNPIAAYYFSLEMVSASVQVRRLADGLVQHAEIVMERAGIDVADKIIVPCVLNSLPYALTGDHGGVYVTDASGLKRFFQDRYFHIVHPHRLNEYTTVLHRTGMKALWSGEEPTPADLVSYLANPLQLQLALAHTEPSGHSFGLGERSVVAVADLAYLEMTTTSISDLFNVDPESVMLGAEAVKRAIAEARREREPDRKP